MTDAPDVIDTLFPDVRERPLMDLDGTTTHEPTRTLYTAESIRKILAAAGWVVVKADGLQHGDELVPCYVDADGDVYAETPHGPDYGASYGRLFVRRSVPENGERPHTHTRGIDRGDCPECDAEYGDTEQVELGF